jgi:hypothetical protein
MARKPKLIDHQKREAIKRRDHSEETLAEIGRSYNVSGLHLQHEARCGSGGVDLLIRANDATLGGYSSVSGVGYMCLRA